VSWQINRDREVSRRHVRRLLARHRPQDRTYESGPQDAGPQDAAPPPEARTKCGGRRWVTSLSPSPPQRGGKVTTKKALAWARCRLGLHDWHYFIDGDICRSCRRCRTQQFDLNQPH